MLEGGAFDEIPQAQVVVTTLAFGGVLLAGGFGDGQRIRSDAPASRAVTSTSTPWGCIPAVIRAVVAARRGPCADGHRLADRRGKVGAGAAAEGLRPFGSSVAEQQMVASGNTLRLLKIT